MAARLIRPLYARLDVRTGRAEMTRPPAASNTIGGAPRIVPDKTGAGVRGSAPVPPSAANFDNGGSIKVQRDDKPITEDRREPSLSPPQKEVNSGSIKVQRNDQTAVEERREPSLSPAPKSSDGGSIKVARNDKPIAEERREPSLSLPLKSSDDGSIKAPREDNIGIGDAPLSPPPKTSEDGPAKVLRNDKIVIEDLEREHEFRAALASSVEAGNRLVHRQERLETGTIVRIAAAVIVVGLGFTALLPSMLTRNPVEPTLTLTTSPAVAEPARTEQVGAAQPASESRSDPLPAAAPAAAAPPAAAAAAVPAPPSNAATSLAKAPPVLRGSNTPDVQGEPRATAQSAGKAEGGIALTAAEKAAVTRGLQELEKRAAGAAPRRTVSARPQLTAEEQAAVERGLRELAKTAGEAKP